MCVFLKLPKISLLNTLLINSYRRISPWDFIFDFFSKLQYVNPNKSQVIENSGFGDEQRNPLSQWRGMPGEIPARSVRYRQHSPTLVHLNLGLFRQFRVRFNLGFRNTKPARRKMNHVFFSLHLKNFILFLCFLSTCFMHEAFKHKKSIWNHLITMQGHGEGKKEMNWYL